MQNKQISTQILGFTAISILLILVILFFTAPAGIEDFCKFVVIAITPFSLLAALMLSTMAVYFNKRQILGWISLIIIITLFSITIYWTLGLEFLQLEL
jgi:hypothetical protein